MAEISCADEILKSFMEMLQRQDPAIGNHSQRVAILAVKLARKMGMMPWKLFDGAHYCMILENLVFPTISCRKPARWMTVNGRL